MVQLLGNVIDKLYFYPECNHTFDGAFEYFGRMYNRFNLWGLWQVFFGFFSSGRHKVTVNRGAFVSQVVHTLFD